MMTNDNNITEEIQVQAQNPTDGEPVKDGLKSDVGSSRQDNSQEFTDSEQAADETPSEDENSEISILKRLEALEAKEKEFKKIQLRDIAVKELVKNELSETLVDCVVREDEEKTLNAVKEFKDAFDTAVQARVETILVGKTPYSGSGCSNYDYDSIHLREEVKQSLV